MIEKFFDYLSEKLNAKIILGRDLESLEITESAEGAKLKKITFITKQKNIVLTLDVNNIKKIKADYKILGYLKDHTPSVDGIILVKSKEGEKYKLYILHIELKSKDYSNSEVNKKFIYSKHCIEQIMKSYDTEMKLKENTCKNFVEELNVEHRFLLFSYIANARKITGAPIEYAISMVDIAKHYNIRKCDIRVENNHTSRLKIYLK